MPYDPTLDKELFREEHNFEGTRLIVGVYQYRDGEKKLQLTRQNVNSEGELSFSKLGRLRKEELKAVMPSLEKALEVL
jgi:hypothetical protein